MSNSNQSKIFKIVYEVSKTYNLKIEIYRFDYDINSMMGDICGMVLDKRVMFKYMSRMNDLFKIQQLTMNANFNHNIIVLLFSPMGYRLIHKDNFICAQFNNVDDVKFINKLFIDSMSEDCPVCYEKTEWFFSCQKCLNKVCYNCAKKLTKSCPFCRFSK